MPSSLNKRGAIHAAIIMDGNGRWALRRGLSRSGGHRAGVKAVRAVIEAAQELDISILTLFAFSADNWRRPRIEVDDLMWILRAYLRTEVRRLVESGVRLIVLGRRDRLTAQLRNRIQRIERATGKGQRLLLRVAIDYSSRDSIMEAAAGMPVGRPFARAEFESLLSGVQNHGSATSPARATEVDVLIRTGGERRLSDFMLWEAAYAELIFTDRMWPEFGPEDLRGAIEEFHRRQRRFGAIDPIEDNWNHEPKEGRN